MPVAQYNVKQYVSDSLKSLGVNVSDKEEDVYVKLIQYSVGCNPRAMKRLFNAFLLLSKIATNGMDIKDLKVTNLKAAQMVDAIKSNQIDAFIIWEPYSTIAVQSGEGKLLMNSSEIESGHPCCCIVATDDFIANHPDKLDTILKIHENATNYINENPKEAAELLPDDIVPDRKIQGQILENTNFISGLDDEYKQNVMDFMNLEVKLGVLEKPLTESQIFADL
jgi:NitT/TauT family transport system substrate-binding protein